MDLLLIQHMYVMCSLLGYMKWDGMDKMGWDAKDGMQLMEWNRIQGMMGCMVCDVMGYMG